jgi:hypothetical protein
MHMTPNHLGVSVIIDHREVHSDLLDEPHGGGVRTPKIETNRNRSRLVVLDVWVDAARVVGESGGNFSGISI